MNENDFRRRPRLDDVRGRADGRKNRGFFLTGFQTAVCVICIVAALAIKQFGGAFYITARAYVKDALKKGITNEEVSQVLRNIRDQFPDAAEVFSNGMITSSQNELGTSQKPQKNSEGSPRTSSPAVPQQKTSGNLTASAFPAIEAASCSFESFKGCVPEEKPVLPPSTASFAPFLLSIKPVEPVKGRITSAFGYRINPITGKCGFHTGMDIAAAEGTPIVAAFNGKVVDVKTSDPYYGNCVTLDHGNGIKTFYGHCETVTAKQGQMVSARDIIAKVGSTGA